MWCRASASTWIHETVRHTWRFDFDSSNSFSVFVICSLKYVEQKEKCVCFVLFLFFAFVPACLARHFTEALCCCCFFFFVCFISQVIWLVSESNFAPVSPCTPPLFTDILTFTHFPKLTRCLHTPNKSILHSSCLERHSEMWQLIAALKTCRLLLMFLVHKDSRRPDLDSPPPMCVLLSSSMCG